jgi:hypothetical protein
VILDTSPSPTEQSNLSQSSMKLVIDSEVAYTAAPVSVCN